VPDDPTDLPPAVPPRTPPRTSRAAPSGTSGASGARRRGRLHRALHANPALSLASKLTVGLVGTVVVAAGVLMLVTPGPAVVVIPLGLAILALEFTWAENLLEKSLEQAERAKRTAANTSTAQRVLTGVAVALGVAAYVAWVIVGDVPVLPG